MDNEKPYIGETIFLDKDTDAFIDDDGLYELIDNNWFEVCYTAAKYTKQVIH